MTKFAARLPAWGVAALCSGLGGCGALGLAPNNLWFVALFALALVFGLAPLAQTRRQGALWLWAFGVGYFAVGLRWIVEPFQIEADLFGWMAPFALVLMACGLALFWALAGWLSVALGGTTRRRTLSLVVALSLGELARAYVLTGFPWAGLAQIWIDTPFSVLLALLGSHGLGALTFLLAALPALLVSRYALEAAALPTISMLLISGMTSAPSPVALPADAPIIRIVQPNAPQDEKWAPDKWLTFFWRQVEATRAAPAPDLVVWPETAIPQLLEHAEEALAIVAQAAGSVPVILGIQRRDESLSYFNALIVTGVNGGIQDVYDKHHLVPFGEYMPFPALFRNLGIRALAQRADAGFTAGQGPRLIDVPGIGKALPLICYEAVFARHARVGQDRPRVLLQITNDAWFGTYAGPQQHLAQARMRAIEQGLPLVRSANTGISAMIDARGRITASLPLGQHGYLDAPLPVALAPPLYARSGDFPATVVFLLAFVSLLVTRRRYLKM